VENEDALLVNRIGKIKEKRSKKKSAFAKKKNVKNCMLCPHLIVRFSDGLKIATSNASKFTSIALFRKESVFFLVDARKVDVELLVAFEAHGLVAHTAAHDREANDGGKRSGVHAQRARGREIKE